MILYVIQHHHCNCVECAQKVTYGLKANVVYERPLDVDVREGLETLEEVDKVVGGHVGVVPDCNMLQCGCTPRNFKSIFKDISCAIFL